jgi:tripartite-type tricarboxylate transporter receptor subunit TctC
MATLFKRMLALLTLAVGFCGATAQADNRPVKIIIGYAAGGATDTVARFLGKYLGEDLGRPVIVENRPGGLTLIANRTLAKADPNSLTFMLAPMTSTIFREIMYPLEERGYSMVTDFAPIATLTTYPLGLAVSKGLNIDNVQDFVEWVKKNPDQASYGSSSAGSHTHLIGAEFAQKTGTEMLVVPYPSNGASAVALMGNQIPAAVITSVEISTLQHGMQVLGIFTGERSPLLPNIKTMREQGVDVVGGQAWMGLWAPAKTPQADVRMVADALQRVLANAEVNAQLQQQFGMTSMYKAPDEMRQYQDKEMEFWKGVIDRSGFSPNS